MNHIYNNMQECNPGKIQIVLIVFFGLFGTMISHRKPDTIVTKLFPRDEELSICFVFIM